MSDHNSNIMIVGLIVRDGRIFLARRASTKKIFPNRYEVPGGHVEPGETPQAALKREMREEFGIDVRVGSPVDSFTCYMNGEFCIEVGYFCYLDEGVEPKLNPEDHNESRWIEESEIATIGKDDEETDMLTQAFKMIKSGFIETENRPEPRRVQSYN